MPSDGTRYRWRRFVCADCPEDDAYQVVHPVPDGASYERGCDMHACPRCGSIGGFVNMGADYAQVSEDMGRYGVMQVDP